MPGGDADPQCVRRKLHFASGAQFTGAFRTKYCSALVPLGSYDSRIRSLYCVLVETVYCNKYVSIQVLIESDRGVDRFEVNWR